MASPKTVRVKLLSDDAGAISFSPVVAQEMPIPELIGRIVAQVGKDEARVRRILRHGSMVSGASRITWEGWDPGEAEIEEWLSVFPDAEPERCFEGDHCHLVVFHFRHGGRVELERQTLERRRMLRRRSFWDELLRVVEHDAPRYEEYSYREKADRYRADVGLGVLEELRKAAGLLAYSRLTQRLQDSDVVAIDLFVERV